MDGKIIKSPRSSMLESLERTLPPTRSVVSKVVEGEVVDAHEEARRILSEVRKEAAEIIAQAREEADRITHEAEARGSAKALAEWQGRLLELPVLRQRVLEAAREELLALSVRIAERVLLDKMNSEDGAAFLKVIEEAVVGARGHGEGRIRLVLNPDDRERLTDALARLTAYDYRWQGVEIVCDEGLGASGCRVETLYGTIDAGLETQLLAIERALTLPVGGDDAI